MRKTNYYIYIACKRYIMYRLNLFAIGIFLIGIFASCEKDDDDNGNGSANDPCENVTCLNGGLCENGECDCPEMYTGDDCGEQATPTSIRVTQITLNDFPPQNNGDDWDGFLCGGGNPDILITLDDGNGEFFESPHYSDVVPGTTLTFTQGFPATTNNPENLHIIRLYDNDTGGCSPDDYMGGLEFSIYNSSNDFPETIEVYNSSIQIEATLHIEYLY